MARIRISNDPSGRIIASFPYNPVFVWKIKTIEGRRWHPAEKHWSFPNTDGKLGKILKLFEGEEVHISPELSHQITSNNRYPTQVFPQHNFEDLEKELTLVSEITLETLRHYWREHKPEKWLLPGARDERHLSTRTVQAIFDHAKEKAALKKMYPSTA